MAILTREQFEDTMKGMLGNNYDAVQRGLERGVNAAVGAGGWQGSAAAPPPETPPTPWGEPPAPVWPGSASAGVQSIDTSGATSWESNPLVEALYQRFGPKAQEQTPEVGATEPFDRAKLVQDYLKNAASEPGPIGDVARTATAPTWADIANGAPTAEIPKAVAPPANMPSQWEREFYAVHGRMPGAYDALANETMQGRMKPGQTPTSFDWIALTRDLNRGQVTGRSVYGPDNVPEYMPGYGPDSNPALRAPLPAWANVAPVSAATQPVSTQPVAFTAPSTTASTGLSQGYATYKPIIEEHAKKYGVDPNLVASLIQTESAGTWNPSIVGDNGASHGLMQIHNSTAPGLGLTPDSYYDPRSNIDAGTKYLASQLKQYAGTKDSNGVDQSIPLALAAYNMGGANLNSVLRGEMAMPASTKAYVKAIMDRYEALNKR